MNNTSLLALHSLPINSTDAYIARLKQIPVLTAQEEMELANRYYNEQDIEAAKKLIISNLRFVVHIAQSYIGYGLALADLIQEGNIGLMKAVKRFDPKVGVRLISFAVHWIKAEIQEFILKNWRIVKVATTKAQRKLFFNLRKLKPRLGTWFSQKEIEVVARDLGVKPGTVREMEARLASYDASIDAGSDENSDTNGNYLLQDSHFEDNRYDPARLLEASDTAETSQHHLYEALAELDERSQSIINERWLTKTKSTLQELAARYQVSAERIRQLEQKALKALQSKLQEKLA